MELYSSESIIQIRKDLGLTQKQLANHLGVTEVTVSRWENGHVRPGRLARKAITNLVRSIKTQKDATIGLKSKTRKQLAAELISLRKRISDLESAERERDIMAQALWENEEKFKQIGELCKEGTNVSRQGVILYCNNAWAEILGYRPPELVGVDSVGLVLPAYRGLVSDIISSESEASYEMEMYTKNSTAVSVEVSSKGMRRGSSVLRFGTIRDITDRKRNEELFKTLSKSYPAGIFVVQNGKFQYLNPQLLKCVGFDEVELLGKDSCELVHPEDRNSVRGSAAEMLKKERQTPYEFRVFNKNGQIRWIRAIVVPVYYNSNRATLGYYIDITAQRYLSDNARKKATSRETEILQLIGQGRSNAEIARRLFISPRTIEWHRYQLMQKFHLSNQLELVRLALKYELLEAQNLELSPLVHCPAK